MTGEELKQLRLEAGMTQGQLGDALGMSHTIVCAWEKGNRPIPAWRVRHLKDVLAPTKNWDNGGILVLSWH